MYQIKKYEPMLIVYYKDIDGKIWTVTTPEKYKDYLKKALETKKFIEIEWIIIKTDLVMKVEKYEPSSDFEKWYLTLPGYLRKAVEKIQEEVYQKKWQYERNIENMIKRLRKRGFNI